MGVTIVVCDAIRQQEVCITGEGDSYDINFEFDVEKDSKFDLIEVIDGCCDVSVVKTGTMVSL